MSIYYYLNGSFLDMIGAKFLTTGSWSMRFVSELSITGFWAETFRDTLQFAFSGFSKACVFFVIENASIDSRPHYRFDAFRLSALKRAKKIALCDLSWTLCACHKLAHLWYFRLSFSFWYVFHPGSPKGFPPFILLWYVRVFVLIHFKSVFKSMRLWWKRSAY